MKKVFGFFANKQKSNKLFFAFILISSLLILLLGGLAFSKIFKAEASINQVSKTLNTYEINLEYEDNYKFNANQILNYKNNTGEPLELLKFNLYATAFNEGASHKPVSTVNVNNAYPNGIDYGVYEIESVSVNGAEVNWELEGLDDNILIVNFANALKVDEKTKIEIKFNFTLPNVLHRYGYGENTLNVANFYPTLAVFENGEFLTDPYHHNGDPFYTDMASYKVNLTVPEEFVVANTGVVKNTDISDGVKTLKIEAKVVRDFAFVMSEKFVVIEKKAGNVSVKYYYYNDTNPSKSLDAAADSITTFSKLFGSYPYSVYSVVETGFVHGGMEYPMLVYVSDSIDKHEDYVNVIIHETAHQWWYQLVGSNAFREPWLDEALTEYSTIMFYNENAQYNVNTAEIILNATNSYVSFIELCESVLGHVDTSMNRALNQYDTEPEYVYITYIKGLLMFDELNSVIGNKNFERGLQSYFSQNKFSNTTQKDLVSAFERVSLRSLKSFFSSWVDGKVIIKNVF